MFKWFHKRKINKLVEAAKTFVNANYKESPKTPGTSSDIRHAREVEFDTKSNIQYSFSCKPKTEENNRVKYSEHDVQYSLGDNYDSRSIDHAVRSLASTDSPRKILQTLEDNTNISFVDKMLDYIDTKHMRDSDVYKAAKVDRRLFSKIVSDRSYKPAKDTCIALSLALQLSLSETNDILSRAGYALSHSSKRDVVIEYFFREHIYDLNDANEILFRLEQKLIGR